MLQDVDEGAVESVTGTVGLGLLVLAAGVMVATRSGRPAAKGAIRGWLGGRDKAAELGGQVRACVAERGERIEGVEGEAKAEGRGDTAQAARA